MPSLKQKVSSGFKSATKWDYEATLKKVKDKANFDIDKQGRFAARFFQGALAVISYYWLASQEGLLVTEAKLKGTVDSMMYVSICVKCRY